uniref:SDR family oxidoreductase n=1 Tax=Thaumasiovibrio occultus TaxID=1891184 RepID=UPI000B362789|nr:SDR family oxidoreductase [Thaumasiovibrio occultus]
MTKATMSSAKQGTTTTTLPTVAVFGLGWLGAPLGQCLVREGHKVVGSVTSQAKQDALQRQGIEAQVMALPREVSADTTWLSTVPMCDVAVINIPPSKAGIKAGIFADNVLALAQQLQQQGCSQIIFISTTSVYGETRGEISESTPPTPNTASGKAHVEIEQGLFDLFATNATVLRLSGLIGSDRHPVRSLVKKPSLTAGGRPVNLIRQDDVIAAILAILQGRGVGEVLHLASNDHPSRSEYYTQMADIYGLDAPNFIDETGENDKRINASKSFAILKITPRSIFTRFD